MILRHLPRTEMMSCAESQTDTVAKNETTNVKTLKTKTLSEWNRLSQKISKNCSPFVYYPTCRSV